MKDVEATNGHVETRLSRVLFLLIIIAAGDITSIDMLIGNVRLVWLFLPILVMFIPRCSLDPFALASAFSLFLIHLCAAMLSDGGIRAAVYSGWILFSYFFFYRIAWIIANINGARVWSVILSAGRLQCIVAIVLVLLGLHERAQFLYFEPSYMAIGLVPYVFSSALYSRHKLLDVIIISSCLVVSASANLALIIGIAVVFVITCELRLRTALVVVSIGVIGLVAAVNYIMNESENPNHGLVVWISENGLDPDVVTQLIGRGGNRVPRAEAAIQIAKDNWPMGVGPGLYADLTMNMNFSDIHLGLPYLDPAGLPPTNVLVEATLNAGIFASLIIIAWVIYCLIVVVQLPSSSEKRLLLAIGFTLFLVLQVESNYLRAYVWLAAGLIMGRASQLKKMNVQS
jgi:hypothetical protein